jgi:ATP-binding cassette subfamily B protein
MHFGDIMAFIQYVNLILFSLMMVSMLFILIPRAEVSAGRINEVLDIQPSILDPKNPAKRRTGKGKLEFKNVSFTYKGAKQKAISGISFSAGPGEVTAIIGGTGSGKSTLVNLIPRFYDVEEGSIEVDSMDVRDYPQAELRPLIGYVAQKAMLFTGTVADNIRLGNESAGMEDIIKAAKTAQAHDFIQAMPAGYDSILAQAGRNLSGGQKQRLCIARALAVRPEIYIFDDSFSALDFKTDSMLRAELKKELKDSTVIIVAQRVTTVMDADRIIVLEDGRAAGMGTHKELFATCKVYREIVLSQVSPEEVS